ncbi:MAG TPA: MCP four helix bundle domain-containing protein [Anaeromyxobacteraceae bacterium]|nr:MCP four helix bundle domain-containing protein [Anaeromyxobacteraceae bacterium]
MALKPRTQDLLWMIAGAATLAVVMAVVWHFRERTSPAKAVAFKATRVDVVGKMQLALARSAEAEKSAVLATTDQDSQTFADQAQAATAEVEHERQDLAKLLLEGGTQQERELLDQFTRAFRELQRVDDEVLRLAVKNTNLKAYALLFGPASDALGQIDGALSRLSTKASRSPDAKQVMQLAFGARTSLLRIQVQLAPHIAEESDAKMDALEASMGREQTDAIQDLDGLAALAPLKGDPDLAQARAAFGSYLELKKQILALSRENTNVRSLAISLNQKRNATVVCMDALSALKQAILEEPIAGVTYGRPVLPR